MVTLKIATKLTPNKEKIVFKAKFVWNSKMVWINRFFLNSFTIYLGTFEVTLVLNKKMLVKFL